MITYPKNILVSKAAGKYLKTNFVVLTKGDGNAPAVIIDKNNPAINNKEIDLFYKKKLSLDGRIFSNDGNSDGVLDENIMQDFRVSTYARCLNPLYVMRRYKTFTDAFSGEDPLPPDMGRIFSSKKDYTKYLLIAPQEVALEDKLYTLACRANAVLRNSSIYHNILLNLFEDSKNFKIQQELIDAYPPVEAYGNFVTKNILNITFTKAAEAFGGIPTIVIQ